MKLRYNIEFSPDAEDHLRALTARNRVIVLDSVDKHRKMMRPNLLTPWMLRIGNLRVYYDVEEEPQPIVCIIAIGIKERNQVRIGSEVIEL